MIRLGHYHAHENPGGVEILEMRLLEVAVPQGAYVRGWVSSPDLRTAYGLPPDALAVQLQLKAKAVCPTWSNENCVAMITAGLRKGGGIEQTSDNVYAESWKPAGQVGVTPRTIGYNTVTVALAEGKFEVLVQQNIVNHAALDFNAFVVGYWHEGT